MKQVFFKIYELPTHQVLVHKDFDEDSNPILVISFFLEGVKLSHKLGYDNNNQLNFAYEQFNEVEAQKILDSGIEMFASVEN